VREISVLGHTGRVGGFESEVIVTARHSGARHRAAVDVGDMTQADSAVSTRHFTAMVV